MHNTENLNMIHVLKLKTFLYIKYILPTRNASQAKYSLCSIILYFKTMRRISSYINFIATSHTRIKGPISFIFTYVLQYASNGDMIIPPRWPIILPQRLIFSLGPQIIPPRRSMMLHMRYDMDEHFYVIYGSGCWCNSAWSNIYNSSHYKYTWFCRILFRCDYISCAECAWYVYLYLWQLLLWHWDNDCGNWYAEIPMKRACVPELV